MKAEPKPPRETANRILDVAEELIQKRGFNGFSYADVAAALGITKASLHYHYATKAALGAAVVQRYTDRFFAALARSAGPGLGARSRLAAYAEIYSEVLREQRLCLCGMLAAEYNTLPEGIRNEVLRFMNLNEKWLTEALDRGRAGGELRFEGPSEDRARLILSTLEGAMLVFRPYGDLSRFKSAAEHILATV